MTKATLFVLWWWRLDCTYPCTAGQIGTPTTCHARSRPAELPTLRGMPDGVMAKRAGSSCHTVGPLLMPESSAGAGRVQRVRVRWALAGALRGRVRPEGLSLALCRLRSLHRVYLCLNGEMRAPCPHG